MRFTPKKTEQILKGIIGEEGLPLIKELMNRNNISEFDLASKTKYDIKIIRKMLYILYNNNLVAYTRKKDKQKGWYIYYWTLLPESIRFGYFKMKRDLLEKLKQQLENENKELFFLCPNKCVRLDFDQAMNFDFHCPECGELINQDVNQEKIARLKEKIVEIEKELQELREQRHAKRQQVRKRRKDIKARKRKKKQKNIKMKAPKKEIKKKFRTKLKIRHT